jgi:hypothetical protein
MASNVRSGGRDEGDRPSRIVLVQPYQAFALWERQRAKHDRVDRGEHRAVGADAETECDDHDRGKAGALAASSGGIAQIGEHVLERDELPCLAAVFGGAAARPELASRGGQGVGARQSFPLKVVGATLEVELDFGVQIRVERVAPAEMPRSSCDVAPPGHRVLLTSPAASQAGWRAPYGRSRSTPFPAAYVPRL